MRYIHAPAQPPATPTVPYTTQLWTALSAALDLTITEWSAPLAVPGVSEIYLSEFETLTANSLRTLRDELQAHMQEPPESSTCPELYTLVSHLTPHVGPYMLAQLVQGGFLLDSFNDMSVPLTVAFSLFWCLPPNQALSAYHAAENAANLPQRPSLKSTDGKMPLFGKLDDVTDVISALLHFAAMISIMCKPAAAPDHVNAMVFLCEMLARTLHAPSTRSTLMQPFDQARVRCHHALALAHEVVSKCLKGLTNFRAKRAAIKEGAIPIDPVRDAITYIDATFARRLSELGYLALDNKLLVTFAAVRTQPSVAPVSNSKS